MRVVTHDHPKRHQQSRSTAMRYIRRHALPGSTPRAAIALRALVLLLIVLLLIFVGLMHVTGEYQVGGPVLGSILLIGLGAANCAR